MKGFRIYGVIQKNSIKNYMHVLEKEQTEKLINNPLTHFLCGYEWFFGQELYIMQEHIPFVTFNKYQTLNVLNIALNLYLRYNYINVKLFKQSIYENEIRQLVEWIKMVSKLPSTLQYFNLHLYVYRDDVFNTRDLAVLHCYKQILEQYKINGNFTYVKVNKYNVITIKFETNARTEDHFPKLGATTQSLPPLNLPRRFTYSKVGDKHVFIPT